MTSPIIYGAITCKSQVIAQYYSRREQLDLEAYVRQLDQQYQGREDQLQVKELVNKRVLFLRTAVGAELYTFFGVAEAPAEEAGERFVRGLVSFFRKSAEQKEKVLSSGAYYSKAIKQLMVPMRAYKATISKDEITLCKIGVLETELDELTIMANKNLGKPGG